MTKEETVLLKGVALLMMLGCHLGSGFGINLIHIGEVPLYDIINRIDVPVQIFTILGGYGLFYVFQKADKHHLSRIFKLYLHYWVIISIFVTIGHFIGDSSKYPGSIKDIILNYSSFYSRWNYECWFLFPYSLLSLSYPFLFKQMSRLRARYVCLITFVIFFISGLLISKLGVQYKTSSPILYNLLYLGFLLFPFSLGAMLKRTELFSKLSVLVAKQSYGKVLVFAILVMASVVKYYIPTALFSPFYAITFIVSFVLLSQGRVNIPILSTLGRHSMNIWMIHTWFLFYLFPSFIAAFKYLALEYVALLFISFLVSCVVNRIVKFIPIEL